MDPKRLIIALDVPTRREALELVTQLQPLGVMFKVGMQLFYQEGISLVEDLHQRNCSLFLDLKLHDIPHTVARATESLVSQGITFLNVHAQGGPEMMQAAAVAAKETALKHHRPEPLVIAVTLLTSMSAETLKNALKIHETPENYVVHLARLTQESSLKGVVCSAQEATAIRKACGENFVLVTPGIRPSGSDRDDQTRILTPKAAIEAGSDYLVVGRPVIRAEDPAQAARQILEEMAEAFEQKTAAV